MKKCTKCGRVQSFEDFYKASGTRDGYRGDCKSCFRARAKERYPKVREQEIQRVQRWRTENRERYLTTQRRNKQSPEGRRRERTSYLKRKYGITPERYDELLAEQGGVCAICGREPRPDISLHVDHDHETGAIRGLLCFCCNNALGDFEDDYERLAAAVRYLRPPAVDEALDELVRARVADLVASGSAVTN
jgi:hypothetical protein